MPSSAPLGPAVALPQHPTARWAVLDTDFASGLHFLLTWHAWQASHASSPHAAPPARLFYTAVLPTVPDARALSQAAADHEDLAAPLRPLADALASQWRGLLPGIHRLRLADERVQLTLAVGEPRTLLPELSGLHDSLLLHGPGPWPLPALKAATRLLRPGAHATVRLPASADTAALLRDLSTCGFEHLPAPDGAAPHTLHARYAPRWQPRRRPLAHAPSTVAAPGRCAVIGAGLAGASVAYSLAARGWHVTVLDRADAPAAGASGLPAGVLAPHVSPDDRPVSRLTRAGVAATLARAAALLTEGQHWTATGVLERHAPRERRLPSTWQHDGGHALSAPASSAKAAQAGAPLDEEHPALWHTQAGWIKPAALVRAMLAAPGIHWRGGACAARVQANPTASSAPWQVLDDAGAPLAEADLVFITAGFGSLALLHGPHADRLPLHALRGQVALGPMPQHADTLPTFPVNGHGSLIAHLPGDTPGAPGPWWITGATFERGNTQPDLLPADHAANHQRLAELLPAAADLLAPQWADGRARTWAGVRATLPDRLPAVGAWPTQDHPPLPPHLLTGLGARGLTLAVLCGDIAAAWLHGDPLPVAQSLAQSLRAARWVGG
ncbi:MAG: FAD-dependent 5-carboxymethylaminomethyl-2-thiouridine(34) oxidoreductase MnmC [Pseudomonadota bacterium]|nr:FAD-dependent 5-carboxymethylaminomethyl-2-thiouridine(34) oxidoreductase MnmC [Pseudomonadota bacterium]